MIKQIIFSISLLITLVIFFWTIHRIYAFMKLTKPFPIKDYGKRFKLMLEVAFGQTKILRFPVVGFLHALVFWGFLVILIGSIEMVIDGLFGTERILSYLGVFYDRSLTESKKKYIKVSNDYLSKALGVNNQKPRKISSGIESVIIDGKQVWPMLR